jgi:hypothetical protein
LEREAEMAALRAGTTQGDGNGGKTGSTALESAAKQAEVVKLRLAGLSLDEIAARVGLAGRSGAHYHVTKWVESLQPSSEMAEEYRQAQLARAEERYRRFRPLAMGEIDRATGESKREPDWQAVNAIQRDSERTAIRRRQLGGRRAHGDLLSRDSTVFCTSGRQRCYPAARADRH